MTIPYRVFRIETKQFAIFPDYFENGSPVKVNSSFSFAPSRNLSAIRCKSRFDYVQGDNNLLVLELYVDFQIAEEGIANIKKEGIIPVDFLRYMGTIVVGTARGIIHSKREGTVLNSVVLPPINLVEVITKDMQLDIKS